MRHYSSVQVCLHPTFSSMNSNGKGLSTRGGVADGFAAARLLAICVGEAARVEVHTDVVPLRLRAFTPDMSTDAPGSPAVPCESSAPGDSHCDQLSRNAGS